MPLLIGDLRLFLKHCFSETLFGPHVQVSFAKVTVLHKVRIFMFSNLDAPELNVRPLGANNLKVSGDAKLLCIDLVFASDAHSNMYSCASWDAVSISS